MSAELSSMEVMKRLMRICPDAKIGAIPEEDLWEVELPETVYLYGVHPFLQARFPGETFDRAIKKAWQVVTDPRAAVFVKGKMPWPSILLVEWDQSCDDWIDSPRVQLPLEKREHYRSKK